MKISGLNKFSLIEYPNEICCVVFTPGCNFRCDYCHNSEFVIPEKLKDIYRKLIKEDEFFSFLEKRKDLITGVSICGGEPTMQEDLYEFCSKIKSMGLKLKLDTNGRDSRLIDKLIKNEKIDYIAMDIKNEIGKFSESAGVELDETEYIKTIKLLLNSEIDYEFRTTVIKGIHNEKTIENISKFISGAKAYYIQNFRAGNTLKQDFKGTGFTQKDLEKFQKISNKIIKNVGIRN